MTRLMTMSVAVLVAATAVAAAAEKTVWVGRDTDDNKVIWTCSNAGNDTWKLKKNGRDEGVYAGVTSNNEFVEVELKGAKEVTLVRLYADKMSFNKVGSKTEWITIAKGKWGE